MILQPQARRAGCDDCQVWPLQTKHDRELPGDHIDDRPRDKEWRNPARTTVQIFGMVVLDQRKPTNPGPDHHADLSAILIGDLDTAIPDSLHTGSQSIVNKGIEMSSFLGRQVFVN